MSARKEFPILPGINEEAGKNAGSAAVGAITLLETARQQEQANIASGSIGSNRTVSATASYVDYYYPNPTYLGRSFTLTPTRS